MSADGPLRQYGYAAVGAGWHPILEAFDTCVLSLWDNHNVQEPLRVLQVKEKFGGLRVYLNHPGLPDLIQNRLHAFVAMAEAMCDRTCEACGTTKDVSCRAPLASTSSWTKTFCEEHHRQRDEKAHPLVPPARIR